MTARAITDEARFHDLWLEGVGQIADPLEQAVAGGRLADRFAWVFHAGYQPAIRYTFPHADIDDWAAFAVSEDRSGTLAPVTWQRNGSDYRLDGHKTWVAGVECMRHLIVKAGRGPEALYFVIDRDAEGLELSTKPKSFLPGMSEGVAALDGVMLSDAQKLDIAEVKRFGPRECLCIYAAFCGMLMEHGQNKAVAADAEALIEDIAPVLTDPSDVSALKRVDDHVQALRVTAAGSVDDWDRDERLIAMYSKGIQSR